MDSTFTPPAACTVLAQLGDAAALIERRRRRVRWTSPAWRDLPAPLATAADLSTLEPVLPGLTAAVTGRRAGTAGSRPCAGTADRDADCATSPPVPASAALLPAGTRWQIQVVPLDPDHAIVRLTDLHEQARAQQRQLDDREKLLFTSRTLSVGEMGTTLAHELNQPIGAAANLLRGIRLRLGRLSQLAQAAPQLAPPPGPARGPAIDPELTGAVERALDQVMFAARVITRIREFTQSNKPRRVRIDVGQLLRDSATLLDWDVRRTGATLELAVPDAPLIAQGDPVMLQQVLVNLIRNALDALRSAPPADPRVRLSLRRALNGHDALIDVADNGCGLDHAAEARLFVPFMSSKPNGMGIGLSICRSFIELHQGRLWFSRNPAGGATFHVGLPLQTGAEDGARTPLPTEAAP